MTVTIGLAQITGLPGEDAKNLEHSLAAAREAFERGADIVVLPELIAGGYVGTEAAARAAAQPLDGEIVTAWSELAGEHDGYIVGGFCESDGADVFNSTVLVGGSGVELHYRKLHLFDREKLAFAPGDRGLPVIDLPFGRVGVCVCYDLRFVEVVRGLALQGADLICVPTAWIAGFDRQKWDDKGLAPQANTAILQANLSQVFIACASQVGPTPDFEFLGSSILVGPRGDLRSGPAPGDREQIDVVTFAMEEAVAARRRGERITPREDRRTDVYGVRIGDQIY